jgi:hypothetical protein
MKSHNMWRQLASLGFVVLVTCGGCWKSQVPMNDRVEGTVKLNGTPLVGVVVEFVPEKVSGLLSGSAITDGQGHYEMQTGDQPGAVIGKHNVIILVGRGNAGRGNDPQAANADDNNPAPSSLKGNPRIPPGYSDLQKPLLTVEVTADKHTDYNFDLGKSR